MFYDTDGSLLGQTSKAPNTLEIGTTLTIAAKEIEITEICIDLPKFSKIEKIEIENTLPANPPP